MYRNGSSSSAAASGCSGRSSAVDADNCDTVGATAVDAAGNFAYATSTGGITAKQRGRIGDVSIMGQYQSCYRVTLVV